MQIRPYQPADLDSLLVIFRKNVPHAFGENEVGEYADFMRTNTSPYFVAEHDGQVLGACGHYIKPDSQTGSIYWVFSDPDSKGSGIGGALLRYNLDALRQHPGVRLIECRTSQAAYGFFEKFGFQLQYIEPDFWAPGLDLYFMTLPVKSLAFS